MPTRDLPQTRTRIGQAVRTARTQRGLTQAQFGALCGCSKNDISQIERGMVHHQARAVAKVLAAIGWMPEEEICLTKKS